MAQETNMDLETFRKQWQEEVSARARASSSSSNKTSATLSDSPGQGNDQKVSSLPRVHSILREQSKNEEQADGLDPTVDHDVEERESRQNLGEGLKVIHEEKEIKNEPSSALEHYEQGVERESQGNLGDSLKHYRKAFRMDAGVDRLYKNKHFPPSNLNSKTNDINPSDAPITVPNTAHHSLNGPSSSTISELIALFSSVSIPPAPPEIEGSPPPPCPISCLPPEILTHILKYCAGADVASFAHLALVCKRLAYLIATEDQLWKGVCLDAFQGFAAMHYSWNCTVSGNPLPLDHALLPDIESASDPVDAPEPKNLSPDPSNSITIPAPSPSYLLNSKFPNYRAMFRTRPRIRFGGCYISTVNYTRPGASSLSQISWNVPVHIVTYFRYLRFFRDGTCISLLTTSEPIDVVHHICRENMPSHPTSSNGSGSGSGNGSSNAGINNGTAPIAGVMKNALRGRWKLTGPDNNLPLLTTTTLLTNNPTHQPTSTTTKPEGAIDIETEGVDADKYVYKMQLGFRSVGRGGVPRNNKLVWKGFWSYNRLTDDWAEFGLRNDRPFFWSRVGGFGVGE